MPYAQLRITRDGHQRPGIQRGAGSGKERGEPLEERAAIAVAAEDRAALDTANDDVVQGTRKVEPRSAWHVEDKVESSTILMSSPSTEHRNSPSRHYVPAGASSVYPL